MDIYTIKSETLQSIADAIRAVSGKTDTILVSNFASEILALKELYSMTIDGVSYNFEEEMTWSAWVGSTYNTAGYTITDEGYITNSKGTHRVEDEEMGAVLEQELIDELDYILKPITFIFTIDGKAYYAEIGMVFADWIDSEYNTDGFISDGGTITTADGTDIELNGVAVAEEDEIMQGGAYVLAMATLATPEIALDGTTLNIYDTEGLATSYDILVDGVVKDSVSAVSLISFTVSGTTHQAENGMTWAEWIESDYNTDGFTIVSNVIMTDYGAMVISSGGSTVFPNYEIIAGHNYRGSQGGSA